VGRRSDQIQIVLIGHEDKTKGFRSKFSPSEGPTLGPNGEIKLWNGVAMKQYSFPKAF